MSPLNAPIGQAKVVDKFTPGDLGFNVGIPWNQTKDQLCRLFKALFEVSLFLYGFRTVRESFESRTRGNFCSFKELRRDVRSVRIRLEVKTKNG